MWFFKIKRVAWVEPTTSLEDFFENSINTQPGGFSKYPLPKSRQHTLICHDINDILKAAGIIMHVHALFCLFRSYCETLSRQNEPTQTQNNRSQYWKNTGNHLGILPVKFLLVLKYLDILSSARHPYLFKSVPFRFRNLAMTVHCLQAL